MDLSSPELGGGGGMNKAEYKVFIVESYKNDQQDATV